MEPDSICLRSRWKIARRKASRLQSSSLPRSSAHGASNQESGTVDMVRSNPLHCATQP